MKELIKHWKEYKLWLMEENASEASQILSKEDFYPTMPSFEGFMDFIVENYE